MVVIFTTNVDGESASWRMINQKAVFVVMNRHIQIRFVLQAGLFAYL
jgi:hypothetical protein